MKNLTLKSFKYWNSIVDYESDVDTVTLLDKNKTPIVEFNYPKFTKEDFDHFKSK